MLYSIFHTFTTPHLPPLGGRSLKVGYQGSLSDDEMKGDGNNYTTEFRQLDTRIGRWFSIDPKATPWESPYVSMGNNPIWRNDVLGNVFDEKSGSKQKADKAKSISSQIKKDSESEKNNLEKQLLQLNNSEKNIKNKILINSKIQKLNERIGEAENAIKEIDAMESSKQIFILKETPSFGDNENGRTYIDKDNENLPVVMEYGRVGGGVDYNTMFHELKHGFQYIQGEISFDANSGKAGLLYDLKDEQAAWKRGSLYNSKLTSPLVNKSVQELSNYFLPNENLNINSLYNEVLHYNNRSQIPSDEGMKKFSESSYNTDYLFKE